MNFLLPTKFNNRSSKELATVHTTFATVINMMISFITTNFANMYFLITISRNIFHLVNSNVFDEC